MKNWLTLFLVTTFIIALDSCDGVIQDKSVKKPFYANYDSMSIRDTSNFTFFSSLDKINYIKNFKTEELINYNKERGYYKKNKIHQCIISCDSYIDRKTFDTSGLLILSETNVNEKTNIPKSKSEYLYNSGNLLEIISYDSIGRKDNVISYSYDTRNNLLYRIEKSFIPELDKFINDTKELYRYSDNGLVSQYSFFWSSKINHVSRFLLDNKNNIIEGNSINVFKSKYFAYYIFNKNLTNLISCGLTFNSSFRDTSFIINQYDIKNRLNQTYEFRIDLQDYHSKTYKYDTYGNLIKEIVIEKWSVIDKTIENLTVHSYKYDSNNLLIREINDYQYFNMSDDMNHSADTTNYEYIFYK